MKIIAENIPRMLIAVLLGLLIVPCILLAYDAMAREQCDKNITEECVVQYGYYKRGVIIDNK